MTERSAIRRTLDDAVVLAIHVTPKAGANAIGNLQAAADGSHALKVRVTQPPDKGKANKAVISLLAKRLGFAKSALEIVAGHTSRDKLIRITGQPAEIAHRIAQLAEHGG